MSNKKIIIIVYTILSVYCSYFILGNSFFSFTDNSWINSIDMVQDLVSWEFFKNDNWKFPIGMNPNYGMDIGNSVVFTGSIAIFAVFFKIINFILPENFHYFNLWYFTCFFLQSLVSYKILHHLTKNSLYSFLGSLFFLMSPIMIGRLVMHMTLAAHWLILIGFFIEIASSKKDKLKYWIVLISLSSLIHFYLTIMLLVIFFIFSFNDFIQNKKIKKFLFDNFLNLLILLLIMFIFGYFRVPLTDSMGTGYGYWKLNLASIFNPLQHIGGAQIEWSNILSSVPMTTGEQIEGFNYLGLGGILLFISLIILFIYNFKKINLKQIFPYILICIIFLLLSLTNKISYSNYQIINISIHDYLYGIFGIIRASGRLFWPIYYLLFIGSIYLIYRTFSNKNSILIIILLLSIQIYDLSKGFISLNNKKIFFVNKKIKPDIYWNNIDDKYTILRTTYLNNSSSLIKEMKDIILDSNFNSTDIVRLGRYNRTNASISRQKLYSDFNNKIVNKNTLYIIASLNHLRNLKHLFFDEDVSFYFINNFWIMMPETNIIYDLNNTEIKKIDFIDLIVNEEKKLIFLDENNIHGLGWSHNMGQEGIWSEGKISTLLFKSDLNKNKKYKIIINLKSISKKKNSNLKFKILMNNNIKKEYSLKNVEELNDGNISFYLNEFDINKKKHTIDFLIENPISPLDNFTSPDGRKLGILIKSIKLIEENL